MSRGQDGWRIVGAGAAVNADGYIQVEQLPNGHSLLRCCWQAKKYVNFDSHNVGSFIYSDKGTGAEFVLEDLTTGIEIPLSPLPSALYDLQGHRLQSVPSKGLYIQDGRVRVK